MLSICIVQYFIFLIIIILLRYREPSVVLRAAKAASLQSYVLQHHWAQHFFWRTLEPLGTP